MLKIRIKMVSCLYRNPLLPYYLIKQSIRSFAMLNNGTVLKMKEIPKQTKNHNKSCWEGCPGKYNQRGAKCFCHSAKVQPGCVTESPGVCCAVLLTGRCQLQYPTSVHVGWDCVCPSRLRSSVLSALKLAPWITLFLLFLLGPPPFALVSLCCNDVMRCFALLPPPEEPLEVRNHMWVIYVSSVPRSWCYTGIHSSVLQSRHSSSLRPGLAP